MGNDSGDGKMQCGKALGCGNGSGEAHKKVETAAVLQCYVWGPGGHLWGFGEQIGVGDVSTLQYGREAGKAEIFQITTLKRYLA